MLPATVLIFYKIVFFSIVNSQKLNSKCVGETNPNLVIEIPYPDKKSTNLLHLHAGSCDQTDFEQFGGSLVYISDLSLAKLTIPIDACNMRSAHFYGKPVTSRFSNFGLYRPTANVTLGASIYGAEVVFKNVVVSAECGFKTIYQIGFEYDVTTSDSENQDCQKVDGHCVFPSYTNGTSFEIKEYTNSVFDVEVTEQNRVRLAGEIIHLSLRASKIQDNFKFAVTDCSILTNEGTRISLIVPGADVSPTCGMDSIGLNARYDGNNFNFQP